MKPNNISGSGWRIVRVAIWKAVLAISFIFFLSECSKTKDIYYCPMHPTYTSDHPGTCPICNMDLVKKDEHADHKTDFPVSPERELEAKNSNELVLSNEKQQSIGIKTETVERRNLSKQFRAYSNVAYDPELYAALTEYKESVRTSAALSEAGSGISLGNLQLRLRQLGLSTEQIRLWISGQRDPAELILGGKGGRAHIYSQIYESDLSIVKVGLPVIFKTDVYPNQEFKGKIKSIDTILDKNTRTLRLRSEVSDPDKLLKPQMFGEVNIHLSYSSILSAPSSSILDTGLRKIAYVQTGPDRFVASEVKTGRVLDSWIEILSGLQEGQRVVSESTFLIDSEAKIRFGGDAHKH